MRQRVLFVSHDLVPEGGGGLVAAWMLQALLSAYDVTLLTWDVPNYAALDRMYGTSLDGLPIGSVVPSRSERWLVNLIPDDSHHQRANYLLRLVKRLAHTFAAVIGSGFESDFGHPGIQYVHYPYVAQRGRNWTIPGDAPLATCMGALLSGRLRPWMLISGYSFERMRHNLTLANSLWSVGEMQEAGMATELLYAPAPGAFPDVPWEPRRDAFVCTGRLVPYKRQDWAADTLALVRREWPDLELHICGSAPDAAYNQRLEAAVKAHGSWVQVHRDLSRADLVALLSQCRYGIHACLDEHFGIAPAEMARAGCIPFVHASGGQVEIVDRDPRLCYSTAEDAAGKILAVLRDRALQDELRTAVHRRSDRFTSEAFVAGFLEYVERFLAARN
jgi:glycosyltransferase involved in cell wall biosynthesis